MELTTIDKELLNKDELNKLKDKIDPNHILDSKVEDLLNEITEDFISNVVVEGCLLTKHRKSNTLEVSDMQHYLEKCWGISIPTYRLNQKPRKLPKYSEDHKENVTLTRKQMNSYRKKK